jgi:hypothetical protein
MAAQGKKQSEQHLIDADGQKLLRERLPRHWVLREYRPDYGIDYALEIFAPPKQRGGQVTYETLGEHIFIQLKSVQTVQIKPLKLYGRVNVEKQREALKKDELIGALETVRFPLETSELVTVERMGVGVPVLLVVADLSSSKCFFVCLNDYIDKILVPRYDDYRMANHRTIHVPVLNEVGSPEPGQAALRWYAKRPKLYAAFQRFVFQAAELEYEWYSPIGPTMARYFATRIASYDFWDDTEMWGLIGYYGAALRRFLDTGSAGIMNYDENTILEHVAKGNQDHANEFLAELRANETPELWRLLSVLPRNYEDVCREWFLPTGLGYAASFDRRESAAQVNA